MVAWACRFNVYAHSNLLHGGHHHHHHHHSLALVSLVSKEFRKAAETMAVSHFRRHFGAAPPELLPRSRLLLFVDQTADPRYLPELVLWSAIHGYVCLVGPLSAGSVLTSMCAGTQR